MSKMKDLFIMLVEMGANVNPLDLKEDSIIYLKGNKNPYVIKELINQDAEYCKHFGLSGIKISPYLQEDNKLVTLLFDSEALRLENNLGGDLPQIIRISESQTFGYSKQEDDFDISFDPY